MVTINFKIPENELEISYTTGSGPGGQARNKTASRARVSWCFSDSKILNQAQYSRLLNSARDKSFFSEFEGSYYLSIYNDESRSRETNRENAIRRLESIVSKAITPPKKRFKTRVPKGSKIRRREDKSRQSVKKKNRGSSIKDY